MEKKGAWPWRKKPEKLTAAPASSTTLQLDPSSSLARIYNHESQIEQMSPANTDDAGSHDATGSTDEAVKMLKQRLLDLSSRLVEKDELASQQARVANKAIKDLADKDEQVKQHVVALNEEQSAREKAETVCISLKQELNNVCQQKNLMEAQMLQLNGALRECIDEIRQSKDQLEHKTQELTSWKREWEKLRKELETENINLKRQLMEAAAENIAISKSLQERGRSLHEINETRARVESESEVLQVQIESLHKDMDAYKYEIYVLKKELQIRNEEIEQNRRLSDITHKQHLESVKKIAKLDSECNRLRALVRKKLPGPAAIAQMRVEVDHVGKKRSPSPKLSPEHRELEALSDRMSALEDETKLLKEVLSKRTAELQAARQLCARTASKLSSAESIIEAMARGQALPALCNEENDATLHSGKCDPAQQQSSALSPAPSGAGGGETMEVMDWALSSEDGNNNDDELSSAESWASALIAELSHLKKNDVSQTEKNEESGNPESIRPCVSHSEAQSAVHELNIKLSSIGERILALPTSMKNLGEQSTANKSKPMPFEIVGQIMEEFTVVKQLLEEVQKGFELERVRVQAVDELDTGVQGSETIKMQSSMVIECTQDLKPLVESKNGGETYNGALRQIVKALLCISRSKVESGGPGDVFLHLHKAVDSLGDDQNLRALSEEVAGALLCKIGDLLKEHCIASWEFPASVAVGQNFVERDVGGDIEMPVDNPASGEVHNVSEDQLQLVSDIANAGKDQGHISDVDKDGGVVAVAGDQDMMDCNSASYIVKTNSGIAPADEDKLNAFNDEHNAAGSNNGRDVLTGNCELILQMELLQQQVEKLTEERDELAAKLVASQSQLEEQRVRVATLDAESALLASERASLAQRLIDTSARNQSLEDDLAGARASLDELRHQVSSLTSELADQAARCQEVQGDVLGLSDVETPGTGRSKVESAYGDGKQGKELEIASAKAQLAECQRSILVLGSQLRALSSVQDAEPSFCSSLESAPSKRQIKQPPPMAEGVVDVMHGGIRHMAGRQRWTQPAGYVRTRGGRLVSAEQYWGSAGDISVAPIVHQGAAVANFSNRHAILPARHSYGAAYGQSPLHEYVTEHSAYAYSPPETALSSPASSPARFDFQLTGRGLKAPPATSSPAAPVGASTLLKTINKPVSAGGGSPSPARKGSRIARFFARAKSQQ